MYRKMIICLMFNLMNIFDTFIESSEAYHSYWPTSPIVQTNLGRVRGSYSEGAVVFYGIPYASPPVGYQR